MKCQQVDMGSHWKIFGGLSFYKKKIKQLKSIWGKIATIDVKILQNFIGPPWTKILEFLIKRKRIYANKKN